MVSELHITRHIETFLEKLVEKWKKDNQISSKHHADLLIYATDDSMKNSIGVSEIKSLISEIYKKPINSTTKLIAIKGAELLTIQAQNSLLKVLEEPPNYVRLVLISTNKDVFVDTVLSRVLIYNHNLYTSELNNNNQKFDDLRELFRNDPSSRLVNLSQVAKDRGSAKQWVSRMLDLCHLMLVEDQNFNEVSQASEILLIGAKYLDSNTHVHLTVDWMLLNLPRID